MKITTIKNNIKSFIVIIGFYISFFSPIFAYFSFINDCNLLGYLLSGYSIFFYILFAYMMGFGRKPKNKFN